MLRKKSDYVGVTRRRDNDKWTSSYMFNRAYQSFGVFDTEIEAAIARELGILELLEQKEKDKMAGKSVDQKSVAMLKKKRNFTKDELDKELAELEGSQSKVITETDAEQERESAGFDAGQEREVITETDAEQERESAGFDAGQERDAPAEIDVEQIESDEREEREMTMKQLEAKCACQAEQITKLEQQLALARTQLEAKCACQAEQITRLELQLALTRTQSEAQAEEIARIERQLADEKTELDKLTNSLAEGITLRRKLHNTIMDLHGNIRVFCRVRPPNNAATAAESAISFPSTTETIGGRIVVAQNGRDLPFTFDKVFDPSSSQEAVFDEISPLVQSALDGYKVCIFAYGQTGSGKTYTMDGLISQTLKQVFMPRQGGNGLKVSMYEIYNDTILDLLAPKADKKKLVIMQDPRSGEPFVDGLSEKDVYSEQDVQLDFGIALQKRSTSVTKMNKQSSRSHFVFHLKILGVDERSNQQIQGVLNFVDLAGSERNSKSGATGDRLKEASFINQSLTTLEVVINELKGKEEYVRYRDSSLTRVLQPYLGGDSKILMFVNVSPESASIGESLCSLRFAARVKACEIGIPRRQTRLRRSLRLSGVNVTPPGCRQTPVVLKEKRRENDRGQKRKLDGRQAASSSMFQKRRSVDRFR